MATGATLFEGENPYVVMNCPAHRRPRRAAQTQSQTLTPLEEIILHAMARNPANRYATAAEMKAELDDYEKVEMAGRWQRLQPPQIWRTRYRLVPLIIGLVLLQVALFFLLFWWLNTSKKHGH